MIDLTMADLANGLHVAIGALFVFVPVAMGWHNGQVWGSSAGLLYGILKEFVFDMEFEDEATSGGLKGGCIDLWGYIIGIAAANVILWL